MDDIPRPPPRTKRYYLILTVVTVILMACASATSIAVGSRFENERWIYLLNMLFGSLFLIPTIMLAFHLRIGTVIANVLLTVYLILSVCWVISITHNMSFLLPIVFSAASLMIINLPQNLHQNRIV